MKKILVLGVLLACIQTLLWADGNKNVPLPNTFQQLDSLYEKVKETDHQLCFRIGMKMDSIAHTQNLDTLKIKALMRKSHALLNLGFFDFALKDLLQALKIGERAKLPYYLYRCHYLIAQVHDEMYDFEKAMTNYQQAKRYAAAAQNFKDTLFLNSEIAMQLFYEGKAEEALKLLGQNLQVAIEQQEWATVFFGFDKQTGIYAMSGKLQEALDNELQILKYPQTFQGFNYRSCFLYNHLAEMYKELKRWDEAEQATDSCYKYALALGSDNWLMGVHRLRSRIAEARGDYKTALVLHRRYLSMKDSVFNEKYEVKMATMSAMYELEKKENAISMLEKDNQLKSSQRNAIVLIALLLLGATAAYFVQRNQRQKRQLQERFSQDLLQSQEQEKRKIAAELHDSIGQNILFIKNQLLKFDLPAVNTIMPTVDNAILEVRNIAKDLYPNQLEKYGLAASLEAMAQKVGESSELFMSVDLGDTEQFLDKDRQIQLYRIVQECVSNTLKHAAAKALRVTGEQQANNLLFVILDNGKGFDKGNLGQKQHRSFGLLGMEERIKLLGGKMELESAPGKGTKWTFILPKIQA